MTIVQTDDPRYAATAILAGPDGSFTNFGITPELAQKIVRDLHYQLTKYQIRNPEYASRKND